MGDLFASDEPPFRMSRECKACGGTEGRIAPTNGQNVVYCLGCGAYVYSAGKVETGQRIRSVSTVHAAITPKKRARVLERATGRCELCGRSGDGTVLHVGHLLSVARGIDQGLTEIELNDEENLCAMCEECNLGIGRDVVPLRLVIAISMARLRRNSEVAR